MHHLKECSKEIIFRGAEDEKQRTVNVAAEVLSVTFRCLSPFMPYLSEELYQRLPHTGADKAPSVCVAPFPSSHEVGLQFRNSIVISAVSTEVIPLSVIVELTYL